MLQPKQGLQDSETSKHRTKCVKGPGKIKPLRSDHKTTLPKLKTTTKEGNSKVTSEKDIEHNRPTI